MTVSLTREQCRALAIQFAGDLDYDEGLRLDQAIHYGDVAIRSDGYPEFLILTSEGEVLDG